MLIRPATPADILSMRALEQQADSAAHWAEREYDALFAPAAPKRIALIAAGPAEDLAGFLIARCTVDEWEIENVVVAAPLRRTGIGRALVDELLWRAQESHVTSVLLEVRESNLAARRLYETTGFIEVGRRAAYYQNPSEDAILLKYSVSFP